MNARYTPGPWSVPSEEQARKAVSVSGVPILAYNRSYDDNLAIFTVPANALFGGREEALANARLIAAAPDMLEALEAFVDGFDPDKEYDATDTAYVVFGEKAKLARSAIAKARGEVA